MNRPDSDPDMATKNKRRLSKRARTRIKRFSLVLAGVLIFAFGMNVGSGRITFTGQTANQKSLPASLDFTAVQEVYKQLKANFDGELDANSLNEGMKRGLVKAAGNPYTEYLTAKEYQDFNNELSGSFTGIGAELTKDDKDNIIVLAPIAGFPAEKAGLKPKDIVAEVDGASTNGLSVSEVVDKIRGPKDTTVKLKIVRDGQVSDVTITRQDISIPSVESKIVNNIGYLKISRYGEDTTALAQKAAQDFKKNNVKGVVLDVRSNPGGLLDSAVDVSSLWLPSGKTVLTERRDGVVTSTFKSRGEAPLQGIPTVVLIDEGSASASEITAGALKDQGAATLIGQKSYGKGSVQQLIKLNDGGVLKVTIARWFTPNGKNIDKAGITPDKVVEISAEQIKNQQDPQKDAAFQALQ